MADPTPAERLARAWREAVADAAAMPILNARPVGVGWATVDLGRATSELAAALDLAGVELFRVAPRSAALGAAARVATAVLPDGGSLVVLEPDTEGRLAGSLARLGEGPVAVWLAVGAAGSALQAPHEGSLTVSVERDGPLGGERLVLSWPAGAPGRHRLLVARAIAREPGTIPP